MAKTHQVNLREIPKDISKAMKQQAKINGMRISRVWLIAAEEYLLARTK
jgi:hypothetical protein